MLDPRQPGRRRGAGSAEWNNEAGTKSKCASCQSGCRRRSGVEAVRSRRLAGSRAAKSAAGVQPMDLFTPRDGTLARHAPGSRRRRRNEQSVA